MNPINLLKWPVAQLFRIAGKLSGRDDVWAMLAVARAKRAANEATWGRVETLLTRRAQARLSSITDGRSSAAATAIQDYWSDHTVWARPFLSKQASLDYIRELTDGRKYKRQLLNLHGPHDGNTIMDYGCGPGNDLAGFTEFSNAEKIVGVDISPKALRLARQRVSWHATDPDQLSFVLIADDQLSLPFETGTFDYIQSLGVIHHTSNPNAILKELARVLKPDGEIRVMLYNADSVHVQLEVGYKRRLVDNITRDLSPEQAFERLADLGAPRADCVRPPDVDLWCEDTGLKSEFLGGYFMPGENETFKLLHEKALADERVSGRQRDFLEALSEDDEGYQLYRGKPAGLGGVYRLTPAL